MKRGLYIHLPFCRQKCHYCDFIITTDSSEISRKHFLNALKQEMVHAKEKYGRLSFDTFYLGGGTPSFLSIDEISEVVQLARKYFDFKTKFEFTLEINPEDTDFRKFAVYRKLGINRISVGAQAFEDGLLKEMNRTHSSKDVTNTIEELKKNKFQNISIDLIIRVPKQTLGQVGESVEKAISSGVTQVTIYDLEIHEKTVYGVRQKRGELELPNTDKHEAMFDLVERILTKAGYFHYELLSFAKPGFESEHNLIYWHNQEYLGLGPGAFSYLNGVRYQFSNSFSRYLKKCDLADWTNDVEDRITEEHREIETLLTGLRLAEGIDLADYCLIRSFVEKKLKNFISDGFIQKSGNRITLTRKGRFMGEHIIFELASQS